MRRLIMLVMVAVALASCEATVVGSNRDGIWFRDPFIGGGDMAGQAQRHCARYGRTAALRGTLEPTAYALPVVAYDCKG